MSQRYFLVVAALVFTLVLAVQAQQASPSRSAPDKSGQDESTIVIPSGTKIKVDVSEQNPHRDVARTYNGKVMVAVRVGSMVAIPARSKVTIRVLEPPPWPGELRELIRVMLHSGSYDLQTNKMGVLHGSPDELVFTLVKDLTIKR